MKDPSFEFNLKTQGYTLRSKGMPAKMALVPVKNLAAPSDSEGSIIIGDHVTLNRSVSQPGKVARPHFHGCEQLINVVSGSAWFRVGDDEKNVTAGDIIHIPIGVEHEFKNTGDGEFIYLSFKNISEDWPPPSALPDDS